jgi:hypothetical protein
MFVQCTTLHLYTLKQQHSTQMRFQVSFCFMVKKRTQKKIIYENRYRLWDLNGFRKHENILISIFCASLRIHNFAKKKHLIFEDVAKKWIKIPRNDHLIAWLIILQTLLNHPWNIFLYFFLPSLIMMIIEWLRDCNGMFLCRSIIIIRVCCASVVLIIY